MTLYLVQDKDFWIYFHDEGEEYFLHYDFWPNVPPFYHVRGKDMMIDFGVRKELEVSNDGCKSEVNYSYTGNSFTHKFSMTEIIYK